MKKLALLSVFLLFSCIYSNAQQKYVLAGMTYGGGAHSCGTVFAMNDDGSDFTIIYSFDTLTGMNPYGNLLQASDGNLYGMAFQGGPSYNGCLFNIDLSNNNKYADLMDFTGTNGSHPYGNLVQGPDGKLYGMTSGGGLGHGVIFSYNLNSKTYNKLYDFADSIGAIPKGDLIEVSNGIFYGLTSSGGIYSDGTLFSFNSADNTCAKLVDLNNSIGIHPYGNLAEVGNGKYLGTTRNGGKNMNGVLFSFNASDKSYSKLYDFDDGNEKYPSSGLLFYGNKLYGMAFQGGAHQAGSIYSFDTTSNHCVTVHDFDTINGASPSLNTLMQCSNGKLYGMTTYGGSNNMGVVFSFDPLTNTYSKLIDFDGINGRWPNGTLTEFNLAAGITTKRNESEINIYPNPAETDVFISIPSFKKQAVINITDVTGRIVFKEILNSFQLLHVSTADWHPGVYNLQLFSDSHTSGKLFIKL